MALYDLFMSKAISGGGSGGSGSKVIEIEADYIGISDNQLYILINKPAEDVYLLAYGVPAVIKYHEYVFPILLSLTDGGGFGFLFTYAALVGNSIYSGVGRIFGYSKLEAYISLG